MEVIFYTSFMHSASGMDPNLHRTPITDQHEGRRNVAEETRLPMLAGRFGAAFGKLLPIATGPCRDIIALGLKGRKRIFRSWAFAPPGGISSGGQATATRLRGASGIAPETFRNMPEQRKYKTTNFAA